LGWEPGFFSLHPTDKKRVKIKKLAIMFVDMISLKMI
jgi:hypothetical protein